MARSKAVGKGRRGPQARRPESRVSWVQRAWPFLVLFLVAAGLRAAYFKVYGGDLPFRDGPIVDSEYYQNWARAILSGEAPSGAFLRAPGYAYFLALVYGLAGADCAGCVGAIQALLGLGTWALLVALSHALWGREGAIWTAVLATLCFPLMYSESKLLPTTLSLFLALASIFVILRDSYPARASLGVPRSGAARTRRAARPAGVFAGALWGLACLVRPNLLLFPLVTLPIGWWLARKRGGLLSVWFWLGLLVSVLPATLHNLGQGEFVLISANGGINFAIGHQSANEMGLYIPPPELGPVRSTTEQDRAARRFAEAEVGHPLDVRAVDQFWMRRGLEFVTENPVRALRLEGIKLLRMLDSDEYPNNYSIALERESIPWLRLLVMPFWALLFLSAVAILEYRRTPLSVTPDDDRKRRLLAWLLALVATSVLSMLFFCVMSRFRVFLTVPLLVFAGGGAATLVRAARERAAGGSPRSWAPIAAAFFLAVIPSILPLRTPHSALAFGHLQAGLSWLDQGNAARALPELQRSVDLEVSADAVLGLCRAVASLGRTEETVPLLQQAEIDFPTDPRFPDLLGVCLRALGRNREARDAYERALEIDPNFGQANFNLGTLFASEGNFRAGVSYFRRSALIDPSDAAAFHRLGRCYRALGLPDSAAAAFRRSLEVAPGYAPSVAELRSLSNQSSP